MPETAQLTVRLDLEGNLTSGITKAQGQLNGLAKSAGRVGKGVGQVGAGFARAGLLVGGAAVTGLVAAAKAGIDFEDAFAGVRKTVDEADLTSVGLSFDKLATNFRKMATEIPIAATEFARLGETAGALGVKAKDIETFVRTTALLGVTTDLTADQAADSLGRLGTVLKFTSEDYVEFADALVALGNTGASTESEIIEISKRFAAEASAAGLAKEEIAGLASVVATLAEPERAGTGLARVFANMGTNISLANDKGKTFAKVTGRSIKELQRDLNKGKGLGLFLDLLGEIKTLSPVEANRTLAALGVTNQTDRSIIRNFANLLPEVNRQLGVAKDATGALGIEAAKRFDTVASKIEVFKNNVIEAGISLSEGFLPAVGRSLDKLSTALKDPGTKADIAQLGKDIGAAIDSIDWNAVLKGAREFAGAMRGVLNATLLLVKAVNALPTELKAAAVGFLALNKLSGGLIGAGVGNIVGGVAETAVRGIGSRIPKVGALFAQPVFVTNWPMGGLGGGVGGAAGKGGGFSPLSLVPLVGVAALEVAVADAVGPPLRQLTGVTAGGLGTVKGEIGGLKIVMGQSQAAVAHQVQTGAVRTSAAAIEAGVAAKNAGMQTKEQIASAAMIEQAMLSAQMATTRMTASSTQSTVRGVAPPIVGAIRSNRPVVTTIVNVTATHVTKSTTIQNRYGPGGGSAWTGTRPEGTGPLP